MAEVVVAGAGVAGLAAALVMGRDGHRVTLLERDPTPLPATPEEAFDWDRRGAPQVRHSHAFLARLRNLLRDSYPDVLDDLFAAGATELRFLANLPPEFPDRTEYPGDEDLVALACRRTTFEWALRRIVTRIPDVTLRDGVSVVGTTATPGAVPSLTGFVLQSESGRETIGGDVFVAAHGRRADVPALVADHDVHIDEEVEDTGIVYFSRFYRLTDGVEPPGQSRPVGGDLGYLKFGLFQGDNHTFSMTLACGSSDDELRSRLGRSDGFDRAASTIVDARPWLDPTMSRPITDTFVMARLLNRRRRFLDDDGTPRVQRIRRARRRPHLHQPALRAGVLARLRPGDPAGRRPGSPREGPSSNWSERSSTPRTRRSPPGIAAAVAQDAANRRARALRVDPVRPTRSGSTSDEAEVDPATSCARCSGTACLPAVRTDPVVLRAFLRSLNLLQPPEQLLADTDVISRVMTVYQERDQRPAEPPAGVSRDELLALLDAR